MIINGEFEYYTAIKAKNGDKYAARVLWEAYRPMMIGMLRHCKYLSSDEKESEAALVFFRKIELFDPAKVNKPPEQWTFSYMLTGGMKNVRSKLKNYFKRESVVCYGIVEHPVLVNLNPYEYLEKNNPEFHALHILDGPALRLLKTRISPIESAILKFRRAGLSMQAIADQMGCSPSKIKDRIKNTKCLASRIFGIDFVPSRRFLRM